MRVLSIITDGGAYPDRLQQMLALHRLVSEHVIIMRRNPPTVAPERTRIILPKALDSGWTFWPWAAVTAAKIVARGGAERWLVNEHFLCAGSFLARLLFGRRVRLAVSLYAPNRSLWTERAWRADPYVGPLSREQEDFYRHRYRRSMRRDRRAARLAHVVTGNCAMIRDDIQAWFPSKKVFVIPNPVTRPREASLPERGSVLGGLVVPTFLYVGLMQPRKGIGLLLHTFQRYVSEGNDARLVLIGRQLPVDRAWFAGLLEQYNTLGKVVHLPHMPAAELAQHYSKCDLFLFPSFYEGSPRVVYEAMARGCPVVSSDIPGTRIIDPMGRAIQFFRPGDSDGLLAHLKRLAHNREEQGRLRQASLEVISQFTHEKVAGMCYQAFCECLR